MSVECPGGCVADKMSPSPRFFSKYFAPLPPQFDCAYIYFWFIRFYFDFFEKDIVGYPQDRFSSLSYMLIGAIGVKTGD